MRLFIVGANGKTGTQLIDLALPRGHQVTAFVRSPEKIDRRDERLQVVRGDALDTEQVARAVAGHDAVISALGVQAREAFRPHTLLADGAASTVAAMTKAGVRRLLLVSAATLFPEKGLYFAFFRWMLAHQIRDLEAAEHIVGSTPLEFTILRPPRLTGGDDETIRAATNAIPPKARSFSYRALARFALDVVEAGTHLREIVGLTR